MKVNSSEIDLLVDWAVNRYGSIPYYIKNGWLQLDDYALFLQQMKDIHHNNQHIHSSDYINVWFNHFRDHKVHFKIYSFFKDEKIITYERFSKAVWDYLKNINKQQSKQEQLTLF